MCARARACVRACVCVRLTGDPGGEGAAGDVLAVVFDQDVVVSGQSGQVADAARPILVVHTADIRFGGTLDGQVQTPCTDRQIQFETGCYR